MSITSIQVNNTELDLERVEYEVRIDHGRNDVSASPEPSSCVITLNITGDYVIPVQLADLVEVYSWGVQRFTGRVSDLTLAHLPSGDGIPYTRLQVTAMGNLARLGWLPSDPAGYAADNLTSRLADILNPTGLSYVDETDYDVDLITYPGNTLSVASVLLELCEWTGATMFDTPNGDIWFQSYTRRGYSYSNATWAGMLDTWADQEGDWTEQIIPSTTGTVVELAATDVIWEPEWSTSATTILNDVTIAWGTNDPQDEYTESDAASIAAFDKRAAYVVTGLADEQDVIRRARHILTTQATERWQIGRVGLILDNLDSSTRGSVLNLLSGDRVLLRNLPQPAPELDYLGVVEGWQEIHANGLATITLSISDPAFSYATLKWNQVTSTLQWSGVDNTVEWADVNTNADLV